MTNNTSIPIFLGALFPNCVTALSVNPQKGGGVTRAKDGESDNGAVMYIIAVLSFYSIGVIVMLIQYLRTEKKEHEEEVNLENFFKGMPDKRVAKEHHVNQMAIRAFHTLTAISYRNVPDDDDEEEEEEDDDQNPTTLLVTDL